MKDELEYWHSSDCTPTPFSLGLASIIGLITSIVGTSVIGGTCAMGALDSGSHGEGNPMAIIVAVIWVGLFIAAIFGLVAYIHYPRQLPIEARRQPRMYFQLGLLIGFGLVALCEGICFAAVGS
jgi:hypothetical protein